MKSVIARNLFWLLCLVLAPTFTYSASAVQTSISANPESEIFDSGDFKFQVDEKIWKKLASDDGVQTYQERESNAGVVAFRGEMKMPTSLKRIAAVLSDPSIRKQWVDGLKETRTLEIANLYERIEYNHTAVPWPFHDRDFVYQVKVKVNPYPATMLITMTSIEDPREPHRDGLVRGQILHAYYYMKELPGAEPSTQVVIEMALDPKGAIPNWVVNLTQKRWPHHTLLALKKIAERPDLVVPKDIEAYFNQHQLKEKK